MSRSSRKFTISAFTETGRAESSIKVPLQRSYTGPKAVIPSSLADTPCAALGIQGVLDRLNSTLGTSYTLRGTPSLSALLEECITNEYDFGTAYGRLRRLWKSGDLRAVSRWLEEEDKEMRRQAVVGKKIVNPNLFPRRVWDLHSNRVVPWWIANETDEWPQPISHAWVAEHERVDVWTPINGREWPVPMPNGVSLHLIRIEMLNLGLDVVWLDVLCMRQRGGPREDLRGPEWTLDVPTIGGVYAWAEWVAIYLSGLGRPVTLAKGDLDGERGWFRRAWTLQEVGKHRIFVGDTPDAPIHAQPSYKTGMLARYHKQLAALQGPRDVFCVLADMQGRVSTNPIDRVAGLAFLLYPIAIPAYYETESLEGAWSALVHTMSSIMRAYFFFFYPTAGLGSRKWRPTWDQVMSGPLPVDQRPPAFVQRDDEADEDWYEGRCIENARVWPSGQLVVQDVHGVPHTFKIFFNHQLLIPQATYTLIGTNTQLVNGTPVDSQYWAFGHRLPEHRFAKFSVFKISGRDEIDRLDNLGVAKISRNILV